MRAVSAGLDAAGRGDFDALISLFAADGVWDASQPGVGLFEGAAAIRGFTEDWLAAYEGWETE